MAKTAGKPAGKPGKPGKPGNAGKVASEFEKLIQTDRSRKKNEALAAKIFQTERRRSAPAVGGTMAARAGVNKARRSVGQAAAGGGKAAGAASLASRLTRPGEAPKGPSKTMSKGASKGASNLSTMIKAPKGPRGAKAVSNPKQQRRAAQLATAWTAPAVPGLSIRGIASAAAEPLVVMAQNFAPGTTAADIESAVTPVGGLVASCRILKTTPLVIAEIVFESREGAQRVIDTFNNQTADGRLLHVYAKNNVHVAPAVAAPPPQSQAQSQPQPVSSGGGGRGGFVQAHVVDGSFGFAEPMDTDVGHGQAMYAEDVRGSYGAGRRGRSRR